MSNPDKAGPEVYTTCKPVYLKACLLKSKNALATGKKITHHIQQGPVSLSKGGKQKNMIRVTIRNRPGLGRAWEGDRGSLFPGYFLFPEFSTATDGQFGKHTFLSAPRVAWRTRAEMPRACIHSILEHIQGSKCFSNFSFPSPHHPRLRLPAIPNLGPGRRAWL